MVFVPEGSPVGDSSIAFHSLFSKTLFEGGWIIPVIPRLKRLRQEDCHEFQASLGCKVRPCLRSHKPKLKIKLEIPKLNSQSNKQTNKSD